MITSDKKRHLRAIKAEAKKRISNQKKEVKCKKKHLMALKAEAKKRISNQKKEVKCKKKHLRAIKEAVAKANKQSRNKNRGANCSIMGSIYEKLVHNTIKHTCINNIPFHTQLEEELGGSSAKNDIECNFRSTRDIGIEVKKKSTPDWMQCKINLEDTAWKISRRSKNPAECGEIFTTLLQGVNLYDGVLPPFMNANITHEEWTTIKKEDDRWTDYYIDIPDDTIAKLYKAKGCSYIQISGKGLYSTGIDECDFGVPKFICEQRFRFRTKIHKRVNSKGFCNLSITVAAQPININSLICSPYSLDDPSRLPPILQLSNS